MSKSDDDRDIPFAAPSSPASDLETYVIDSLIPTQSINLLVGHSGAGKSRLLLGLIETWRRGEDVLGGRKSFPAPFGYLICDRSTKSAIRTMKKMGIDPATIPVQRLRRNRQNLHRRGRDYDYVSTIQQIPLLFPDARVIFVESLAKLMDGSINNYQEVSDFLDDLDELCREHDLTIIGSVHSPKSRDGEQYIHIRDHILGSVAWGAGVELVLYLDSLDPKSIKETRRRFIILPRDEPNEEYTYDFDARGWLVNATPIEDLYLWLDMELAKVAIGTIIETKEFHAWGKRQQISVSTVNRWIPDAMNRGTLEHLYRGNYRRPNPS
jgi:hypothetical protein